MLRYLRIMRGSNATEARTALLLAAVGAGLVLSCVAAVSTEPYATPYADTLEAARNLQVQPAHRDAYTNEVQERGPSLGGPLCKEGRDGT